MKAAGTLFAAGTVAVTAAASAGTLTFIESILTRPDKWAAALVAILTVIGSAVAWLMAKRRADAERIMECERDRERMKAELGALQNSVNAILAGHVIIQSGERK